MFSQMLFFNGGSAGTITANKEPGHIPAMSIINIIIAAVGSVAAISAESTITSQSIGKQQNVTLKFDLQTICGAIISGCVAGAASCNNVHFSSSFIIGIVAGCIYKVPLNFVARLEIDDPRQIFQIHGLCGLWGILAVGIFDNETGLIYAGQFTQLGIQTLGAIIQLVWVSGFSILFFKAIKALGKFRIGEVLEIYGMDVMEDLERFKTNGDASAPLDKSFIKMQKLEIRQRKA